MTVITISRGSKSMGTTVAELVAENLGYQCLSRSVLLEASDRHDIAEIKLSRAMLDAPSIIERLGHRKTSYVAVVQSELARHAAEDKIVYHGHAGHVLLKNVSHVLKVRIVASMELRVSVVMRDHNLGEADARHYIQKVDKGRVKWTRALFGVDPSDSTLYDLVLNIPRFSVEDATALICQSARLKQFATTRDSQRDMDDLVLACKVKAALAEEFPDTAVTSHGGNVLVYCSKGDRHGRKVRSRGDALRQSLTGIKTSKSMSAPLPRRALYEGPLLRGAKEAAKMTSILISSNDPRLSEDLAHQLADQDGYAYLGTALLADVAKKQGLDEQELKWALDGTGGRSLPKKRRELLLNHIQTAALEALAADNVVSTGLAAHLYVQNVSHILHLRVLANPDAYAAEVAKQKGIPLKKATKLLDKERATRGRWCSEAFGVDEYDPELYDIVVQLKQISADRVLQIVRETARFRGFQTMTYSRRCLEDLVLASQVRGALLPTFPNLLVKADGDRVIVAVKCSKRKKPQTVSEIKEIAGALRGVALVEVHAVSNLRDLDEGAEREPRAFLNGE